MSRSGYAYELVMRLWPLSRVVHRLGSWPLLASLLRPCFSGEGHEAIIVPVHEVVRGTESVILPFPMLRPLVERASARMILHECLCRRGESCQAYPRELGCLFLGEGAAAIDPARGRPAGLREALDHVKRAMDAGLVPLIVHASFDAWLLGIPYRRMLAVCFCCDCCCTVRQGLRLGPPAFWETVVRLPGLAVRAGPGCTGCGLCLEVCHVAAISLWDGGVHIAEACKGCGRCASLCPAGAITLHLDEETDLLAALLARVEQRTEIGA